MKPAAPATRAREHAGALARAAWLGTSKRERGKRREAK